MTKKIAIYPGTFDPITVGHMDIIKRATKIFDKLVIAVAKDTSKTPIFSLDERVEMVRQDVESLNFDIEVKGFEGLLVNFAKENEAEIIVRGLRAVSDFEYEFQMSGMNTKLSPNIQTIFLPASESTHFIASKFVKQIIKLGGDVKELVSDNVRKQLKDYYNG